MALWEDLATRTCTRASLRSSLLARSSRVNTSGYCEWSNARSSWCSCSVVKVVRLRRFFRRFSAATSLFAHSLPLSDPSTPLVTSLARVAVPFVSSSLSEFGLGASMLQLSLLSGVTSLSLCCDVTVSGRPFDRRCSN